MQYIPCGWWLNDNVPTEMRERVRKETERDRKIGNEKANSANGRDRQRQ